MSDAAAKGDRIVPGFNVFGYEDAAIIIEVAEELNAPVILMSNKDAVLHMPVEVSGSMFREMGDRAKVPVAIHLDHGKDLDLCKRAISAGYTSVMYDGSQLPLDENIKNTAEIVSYAHGKGISVEAEIGAVGYADPTIAYTPVYTKPEEAKTFVEKTGVDALAVAVGTLHRMTAQTAKIQYHLLDEIEEATEIPLVIHGSTGLPDEDLEKLRKYNVGKMNIGTALRMAFGQTMRDFLCENPQEFDRIKAFAPSMAATKKVVKDKYKRLGW